MDFALVDPLGFSPLTVADFAGRTRTDGGKLERAQSILTTMPVGEGKALDDLLREASCGRRTLAAAKEILVKGGYSFDIRQTGNNRSGSDRQSFWVMLSTPPPTIPADPNLESAPKAHLPDGSEEGDSNTQGAVEECNPASVLPLPGTNGNGGKNPVKK